MPTNRQDEVRSVLVERHEVEGLSKHGASGEGGERERERERVREREGGRGREGDGRGERNEQLSQILEIAHGAKGSRYGSLNCSMQCTQ